MYKSVTGKRTLLLAGYSYSLLEDSHTVAWEGEALCFTATKNIGSRQQEMFRQRRRGKKPVVNKGFVDHLLLVAETCNDAGI